MAAKKIEIVCSALNCVAVYNLKANEKHFQHTQRRYLRPSGCEVGLLINFHVKYLRDGLRRVINTKK
jgi:hypothetical protein